MNAGGRYLTAAVTNVGTLSWGKALAAAAVLAGVALLARLARISPMQQSAQRWCHR